MVRFKKFIAEYKNFKYIVIKNWKNRKKERNK